jgi:hypothetical protein
VDSAAGGAAATGAQIVTRERDQAFDMRGDCGTGDVEIATFDGLDDDEVLGRVRLQSVCQPVDLEEAGGGAPVHAAPRPSRHCRSSR